MIFELPKPILGYNYGFLQEVIDGIDMKRQSRYIKASIPIGEVKDEKFLAIEIPAKKRWIRDEELQSFLEFCQENFHCVEGDWCREAVIAWIQKTGMESKFRVTTVTNVQPTQTEPEPKVKLSLGKKLKKVMNKKVF